MSMTEYMSSVAPVGATGPDRLDIEMPDLEDILQEVRDEVEAAVDFIFSEFEDDWERATEYYNGKVTNLKSVKGRSNVVKTLVRDTIRAIKPSLLRVFFQTDDIVEYEPEGAAYMADLAQQQTKYVNQLFHRHAGYRILYDAFYDSSLYKIGVAKYWCEKEPHPEFYSFYNLTEEQYTSIINHPHTQILSEEAREIPTIDQNGVGSMVVYDIEFVTVGFKPKINIAHVPLHEFFVSRGATSLKDAKVYGHRRNMKVGDAVAMGLEYDDWTELDGYNPEFYEAVGFSFERRGYNQHAEEDSVDPVMQEVLITEVYARFDMYGIGVPQLWRFWFGGTAYELLHMEQVPDDEPGFAIFNIDPIPGSLFGTSLFDILEQEQDTATSILRATCDNAHLSNNKRYGIVDNMVNLNDVLNPTIGHPIRMSQPNMVQELSVQSSLATMLPLLQYLEQDAENKTGVTRASVGLDPDAMQSTTRDAVMNTIQLAEGQIEVMARNLAEGGVRELCEGLLRLSMRNLTPEQFIKVNGNYVPIDQTMFDPTMHMKVNVGLGTGNQEMKLAGLNTVFAQQKEIVAQFGLGNPIVSLGQMYNTIEDITKLMGLHNVSRYFNRVEPEVEKQLAQQAQQSAEQNKPLDPGKALVMAEEVKSKTKQAEMRLQALLDIRKQAAEAEEELTHLLLEDDRLRDEMLQNVEIKKMEIRGKYKQSLDVEAIRAKQRNNKPVAPTGATNGGNNG